MSDNTKKKLQMVDTMTELICHILVWKWNDEENGLVNTDGKYIKWEDFESIPVAIDNILQVNFWGDGTIELQDKDSESNNIYDYDADTIAKVIDALSEIKNSK